MLLFYFFFLVKLEKLYYEKWGMMGHACHSSTQEEGEFKASLCYIVRFCLNKTKQQHMTIWCIQRSTKKGRE
jgi:hypothetical protein